MLTKEQVIDVIHLSLFHTLIYDQKVDPTLGYAPMKS